MYISDFDELVSSVGMSGEVVVRSEKCGREYSVWDLLPSILDGPRCIAGQPERDTNLLVFKNSDFALLSGVELGGRLSSMLDPTRPGHQTRKTNLDSPDIDRHARNSQGTLTAVRILNAR